MATKFAPKNYQDTLGAIVSAFLTAPDFYCDPIGRNFTYDEIFGDIFYGIEIVRGKTKNPEKLAIIEQVVTKILVSRAAFEANQERAGIMALADAKELFRCIKSAGKKSS